MLCKEDNIFRTPR